METLEIIKDLYIVIFFRATEMLQGIQDLVMLNGSKPFKQTQGNVCYIARDDTELIGVCSSMAKAKGLLVEYLKSDYFLGSVANIITDTDDSFIVRVSVNDTELNLSAVKYNID